MIRQRRSRGTLLLLLAGLAAGLGWLNYTQWTAASRPLEPIRLVEIEPGQSGAGALPPLAAARTFEMAPLSTYAEIVSRPVFTPTRRPPVAAARAVEAPVVSTLAASLIGVILSADERVALIPRRQSAAAARERAAGWLDPGGDRAAPCHVRTGRPPDPTRASFRRRAADGRAGAGPARSGSGAAQQAPRWHPADQARGRAPRSVADGPTRRSPFQA